ncbi:MAG: pyridoxal-phosphate dependent enzyme [Anaerolineales bacterium]
MLSGSQIPLDGAGTPHLDISAFEAAARRIRPYVNETYLREISPGLWVKCEYEQVTGSFKFRGALNKVLQLDSSARTRGVVCASAGNHGLGVAKSCAIVGIRCSVYVPASAPAAKTDAILSLGAHLTVVDGGYGLAEMVGLEAARTTGAVWISPYNDADVIAGQGTIGLELARQFTEAMLSCPLVFIPASGGGLVCGVGLALHALGSDARIVGVQTEAAPYLHAALAGLDLESIEERPTIADGLAGPIEKGSVTLSLLARAVERIDLVGEGEIVAAMRWLADRGTVIEPSAAVALAAARRVTATTPKVAVLSGSNVDPTLVKSVLSGSDN